MYTVFVQLEILPGTQEAFIEGIHRNALATLNDEPGCIRFDVHQDQTNPARFYFYEIYTNQTAFEIDHRAAPHYATWRDVVAACVVPGTQNNTYASPLFPDDIPERPLA